MNLADAIAAQPEGWDLTGPSLLDKRLTARRLTIAADAGQVTADGVPVPWFFSAPPQVTCPDFKGTAGPARPHYLVDLAVIQLDDENEPWSRHAVIEADRVDFE